jgi:hypothetical protein
MRPRPAGGNRRSARRGLNVCRYAGFRRRTCGNVVVNGNGVRIAASVHQIERELPIVAEGYTGTNSTAVARQVAGSFVARFINWFMADDEDEVESNRVGTSRPDPVRYLWPVLDIPEQDHRLGPRLWIAEDAIARWMTGDLPEEIVIEEVHTAAEAASGFYLGLTGRRSGQHCLSKPCRTVSWTVRRRPLSGNSPPATETVSSIEPRRSRKRTGRQSARPNEGRSGTWMISSSGSFSSASWCSLPPA